MKIRLHLGRNPCKHAIEGADGVVLDLGARGNVALARNERRERM